GQTSAVDQWWYSRKGCPGTDRSRRSRRTTRRTLRITSGRVNSRAHPTLRAYSCPHDDAYALPVLVGRLTAAVAAYALNGRRSGGRFRFSSQDSGGGRPGRRPGPDEKERRDDAGFQRGQADRASDAGE